MIHFFLGHSLKHHVAVITKPIWTYIFHKNACNYYFRFQDVRFTTFYSMQWDRMTSPWSGSCYLMVLISIQSSISGSMSGYVQCYCYYNVIILYSLENEWISTYTYFPKGIGFLSIIFQLVLIFNGQQLFISGSMSGSSLLDTQPFCLFYTLFFNGCLFSQQPTLKDVPGGMSHFLP